MMFSLPKQGQAFLGFTLERLKQAVAQFPDDYRINPFIHAEHGFMLGIFTSEGDGYWYVGSVNPVTGEWFPVKERGKDDGIHPVYGPLYSLRDDGETLTVALHPRRDRQKDVA